MDTIKYNYLKQGLKNLEKPKHSVQNNIISYKNKYLRLQNYR